MIINQLGTKTADGIFDPTPQLVKINPKSKAFAWFLLK